MSEIRVDAIKTRAGAVPKAVDVGLNITGTVLQVVTASTTTEVGTTSSSFSDTGLTATITPSSTSSKILVIFTIQRYIDNNSGYGDLKLVRGSTDLETFGFGHYADVPDMSSSTYQHLDSPSTTSATTYKIQFNRRNSAGSIYCQYDDSNGEGISTIALMEIAG